MKPRSRVTPFRPSQVRLALEGLLRAVAPHLMIHRGARLRDIVRELVADDDFWSTVAAPPAVEKPLEVHGTPTMSTSPVLTTPIGDNGTRISGGGGHD